MTTKIRKDSWTVEDDGILKEVVLNYKSRGLTLTLAFEEVSLRLNRTKAACRYRYTTAVSEQIENELEEIKVGKIISKVAKLPKLDVKLSSDKMVSLDSILFDIQVLLQERDLENERLKQENLELKDKLSKFNELYNQIKEIKL